MKKLFVAAGIIAMAAISSTVNAQQTKLGIKGGVSFTGVSNLAGKVRTTGHGGLFLQTGINNNWKFQPELIYSAQGQHFTDAFNERRVLSLEYIQAPLMLQYYPVRNVYVEAGPQVGLLINSKTNDAKNGGDIIYPEEKYRKVDAGINAGLGINLTNHIGIYGRYTQGFVDVVKSPDLYRTNHGIQIGAAIKF